MQPRTVRRSLVPVMLAGLMLIASAGQALGQSAGALCADRCVNFEYKTVGDLGPYEDPLNPGTFLFGAKPTPVVIAGLSGTLYSFVDEETISGGNAQGAHHIVLHHHFSADDGISWFQTDDRAVCAVREGEGCRVNDQMRLVSGAGVFANPAGLIRNHGIVNIAEGWLDLDISGRVCGDGLSQ